MIRILQLQGRMTIMTLDDRRLSRCLHLLAIAFAVGALSMVLPAMGRLMGDALTLGTSLSVAAVFVGLPAMIGLVAWSDRSASRTPLTAVFLIICAILAACLIAECVLTAVRGVGSKALIYPFGVLGVSIAFAVAAAFIRDRGHRAAAA